jgi:hypothetical protein
MEKIKYLLIFVISYIIITEIYSIFLNKPKNNEIENDTEKFDIIENLNAAIGNDPPNGKFILPNRNQEQTITINLLGRYIRYRPSLGTIGDGVINPSQIMVFNQSGTNIAINKTVYATSKASWNSEASIVVDGATTIRGISWESNPGRTTEFIEIDLGSNNYISRIKVLQNTSCCDPSGSWSGPNNVNIDRTTNARIEVLYDVLTTTFPASTTPTTLTAPAISTGQYVRIRQKAIPGPVPNLTFSFIDVKNSAGTNLSVNKPAYSTSVFSGIYPTTPVYGTDRYLNRWPWVFYSYGQTAAEWWEVDLESSQAIASIIGYDRVDTGVNNVAPWISTVSELRIAIINFSNINPTVSNITTTPTLNTVNVSWNCTAGVTGYTYTLITGSATTTPTPTTSSYTTSSNTATFSNLTAGTSYTLRIIPMMNTIPGNFESTTFTTITGPTISEITTAPQVDTVEVKWVCSDNTTSYKYELVTGTTTTTPAPPLTYSAQTNVSNIYYNRTEFTNLTASTSYTLKIIPMIGTVPGNFQSTTFTTYAPVRIAGVMTEIKKGNIIILKWILDNKYNNATDYKFTFQEHSYESIIGLKSITPTPDTTSYTSTENTATFLNLPREKMYIVSITPMIGTLLGAPSSNMISVWTAPLPKLSFIFSNPGPISVEVTWICDEIVSDYTYELETGSIITTPTPTERSYDPKASYAKFINLTEATSYTLRIRPMIDTILGNFHSTTFTTTYLPTVSNIVTTPTINTVSVSWNSSSNTTGYQYELVSALSTRQVSGLTPAQVAALSTTTPTPTKSLYTPGGSNTATFSDLTAGTSYTLKIIPMVDTTPGKFKNITFTTNSGITPTLSTITFVNPVITIPGKFNLYWSGGTSSGLTTSYDISINQVDDRQTDDRLIMSDALGNAGSKSGSSTWLRGSTYQYTSPYIAVTGSNISAGIILTITVIANSFATSTHNAATTTNSIQINPYPLAIAVLSPITFNSPVYNNGGFSLEWFGGTLTGVTSTYTVTISPSAGIRLNRSPTTLNVSIFGFLYSTQYTITVTANSTATLVYTAATTSATKVCTTPTLLSVLTAANIPNSSHQALQVWITSDNLTKGSNNVITTIPNNASSSYTITPTNSPTITTDGILLGGDSSNNFKPSLITNYAFNGRETIFVVMKSPQISSVILSGPFSTNHTTSNRSLNVQPDMYTGANGVTMNFKYQANKRGVISPIYDASIGVTASNTLLQNNFIYSASINDVGVYGSINGNIREYGVINKSVDLYNLNFLQYANGADASWIGLPLDENSSVIGKGSLFYLREILIYDYELSTIERQNIEGYLAKKWNIPLDFKHPNYSLVLSEIIINGPNLSSNGLSISWSGGTVINLPSFSFPILDGLKGTIPTYTVTVTPSTGITITAIKTSALITGISTGSQYTILVTANTVNTTITLNNGMEYNFKAATISKSLLINPPSSGSSVITNSPSLYSPRSSQVPQTNSLSLYSPPSSQVPVTNSLSLYSPLSSQAPITNSLSLYSPPSSQVPITNSLSLYSPPSNQVPITNSLSLYSPPSSRVPVTNSPPSSQVPVTNSLLLYSPPSSQVPITNSLSLYSPPSSQVPITNSLSLYSPPSSQVPITNSLSLYSPPSSQVPITNSLSSSQVMPVLKDKPLDSSISSQVIDILKDLSVTKDPKLQTTILNSMSSLLQSQNSIDTIKIPNLLIENSLYTFYSINNPNINTNLPLFLGSTINNSGLQEFNFSKLPIKIGSGLNLVLPLDPGKSIGIDTVTITRGNLTDGSSNNQTNQITIDNKNWLDYDTTFNVGVYTFIYLSSGSPILFQVTTTPIVNPSETIISTSNNLLIIFIIIVVILFIFIVMYLFMSKSNTPPKPSYFNAGE